MDTNKYVGIPYKAKGRDLDGLDCWGLVRVIYKDLYNIDLPSFSESYDINDDNRIQELVHQYREGWEQKQEPESGDVIIFRIFGNETHVGVVVGDTTFIHVREGSDCVIDNFTNTKWKNRIVGFYSYVPNKTGIILNAMPHPLKTSRVTELVVEGTTLEELYEKLNKKYQIDPEISKTVTIIVNGIVVPRISWNTTVLQRTDVVEYRAVPGKEAVKMIALIVIAVYAPYLVSYLGTAISGLTIAGPGLTGMAALTTAGKIVAGAIIMAGSYLINAIAPIRPPSTEDPGQAEQQYLITGARNDYNPYGSIPVVLGKIRMTPPLGAKTFVLNAGEESSTSYLNMLLVWGYGPLTIDETTARIGEVDWDEYEYNTNWTYNYATNYMQTNSGRVTMDRKTAISSQQQQEFDKVYGGDVNQQYSGIELSGPGFNGVVSSGGGGGQLYTNTTNSGTSFTFDILTGQIPSPPPDVEPEVIQT